MRNLQTYQRRILALLCLLIFISLLLFPIHDCTGKDCAICAFLSIVKGMIPFVFFHAVFLALGHPGFRFYTLRQTSAIHSKDTLVLQKVKLSN